MDKLAYDRTICETHCPIIVQTIDWPIITRSEPGERHGSVGRFGREAAEKNLGVQTRVKSEDCLDAEDCLDVVWELSQV